MTDMPGSIRNWPKDVTEEECVLLERLERGNFDDMLYQRIVELFLGNCSGGFRLMVAPQIIFGAVLCRYTAPKESFVLSESVARGVKPEEFFKSSGQPYFNQALEKALEIMNTQHTIEEWNEYPIDFSEDKI
ncbi:MAG: DUF444 family protein [Candidatus Yanofskybacteria bacterium]|nr:DUF444 family protein [Candidatus Yanofskybacteria bacterium]